MVYMAYGSSNSIKKISMRVMYFSTMTATFIPVYTLKETIFIAKIDYLCALYET